MSAKTSTPALSIGLPVYNGENYIARAITTILSQTFTDFELIICDNASTDNTARICREFAETDNRITYLCNSSNIGASANFNKVFHAGKGKYYKWAAHDDELSPAYLERCVAILDRSDDIVLCHAQVNLINESGKIIRQDTINTSSFDSEIAPERFNALIRTDLDNYEIFGVIRRQVLEKTPLVAGYIASDRTLRATLGLHGKFSIIPEPLFLCRDHPERSIRAMPSHHMRGQWFNAKRNRRFIFPHWRILLEYFKCIDQVKELSPKERLQCRLSVLKWLGVHHNWTRLLADPLLILFPGLENVLIRYGKRLANN